VKQSFRVVKKPSLIICAALLVTSCGGGGSGASSGSGGTSTDYSVSVTTSGLTGTLVLQNNGGDNLSITTNGTATFSAQIESNGPYAVTVLTQPSGEACTVAAGSGIASKDVSVAVTCVASTAQTYAVGGTVSGLSAGASLVALDNGVDNLTITSNGPFNFATKLSSGTSFAVTIGTQPTGETCILAGATGTVTTAGTMVTISCTVVAAQVSESVLYSFGAQPGSDGKNPNGLVLVTGVAGSSAGNADGSLFGTTQFGGSTNQGMLFQVAPNSTETPLLSFNGLDGQEPFAGMILATDGNLYGTTYEGGLGGGTGGIFFRLTTGGSYTVLYHFGYPPDTIGNIVLTDAYAVSAPLVQGSDGNFYGTSSAGGTFGKGTVFRLTTGGLETVLYSFGATTVDGTYPQSALVEGADGNFYGTTRDGGTNGNGTVFKVSPLGAETVIHSFAATTTPGVNVDGINPEAALVLAGDGNFYGTTFYGGTFGAGVVFKVTASSGAVATLYSFGNSPDDGGNLSSPLIYASDGNLYGTTSAGGASGGKAGAGTAFKMTLGGNETILYVFGLNTSDAQGPSSPLVQGSSGTFYGTTSAGGINNTGAVFKLTL
jgi:uncharacterized repeat protein (TIGR03803 family)